jgi:hypothetical protein
LTNNLNGVWFGTNAEYDNIQERDEDILYIILTEDTNNNSIGVI